MQMVPHIIDGDQFLFLAGDDAGDVFLQFVVVFGHDEILPAFDGEHDVKVNLRVGVCHARNMSLRTELGNSFLFWFLQIGQPYGLEENHLRSHSIFSAIH